MNGRELANHLNSPQGKEWLTRLYSASNLDFQLKRYLDLLKRREETFGLRDEIKMCSAPGRTEIAGNHTDHNHGRVLAAAIDMDT
ncbi:MAG: galactokinase family protein, partial [Clostridia bacterium]|nr:galactokinase family protein [Clostridia bacterium]